MVRHRPKARREAAPTRQFAAGELLVQLERAVPGGDAIGRLDDGQVLFVTGAVVGDTICVRSLGRSRGVARAFQWDLHTPSSARRATLPCPVAQRCGGCDWMGADTHAQASQKLQLVTDALRRTGGVASLPNTLELTTTGSDLGYRSRARLHISEAGELGFVARKTHGVVAIERCAVCSDRFNSDLARLGRHFGSEQPLASLACRTFAEVELRALAARSEVRLLSREGQARVPEALSPWLEHVASDFDLSSDLQLDLAPPPMRPVRLLTAESEGELRARLAPCVDGGRVAAAAVDALVALEVQIGAAVFSQVNWAVNSRIIVELVVGAIERGHRRFADLYSGNGNFSLPLLTLGLQGVAVEQNGSSVKCARHAAQLLGLAADFRVGSVAEHARDLHRRGESFDLVVLDPAREGAGPALPEIVRLAACDIFYCACDPVSLARDVRWLTEHGFELVRVAAHDMFPQTHHVESAAWLTRKC